MFLKHFTYIKIFISEAKCRIHTYNEILNYKVVKAQTLKQYKWKNYIEFKSQNY